MDLNVQILFNTLCVSLIAVCLADIRPEEINVNIFGDELKSFETEVLKSIEAIGTIPETVEVIVKGATPIPLLGESLNIIIDLCNILSKSKYERILVKAIADQTERQILQNKIPTMTASMKTISDSFYVLNQANNLSCIEVATIININTELSKIINEFYDRSSNFRKHTYLAYVTLSALAPLVKLADEIKSKLDANYSKLTNLSCKLMETLFDYRKITMKNRLKAIHGYSIQYGEKEDTSTGGRRKYIRTNGHQVDMNIYAANAYIKTYDPDTPIADDETLEIVEKGCDSFYSPFIQNWEEKQNYVCIKDKDFNQEYFTVKKDNLYCVTNFLKFIVLRIDKLFDSAIKLLGNTCKYSNLYARKLTDSGWLDLTILSVYAVKKANSDEFCDPYVGRKCDPYVKISIEGNEVFRTETESDKDYVHFFETFNSGLINKKDEILIEIFDADTFGSDDISLTWKTNVTDMLLKSNYDVYQDVSKTLYEEDDRSHNSIRIEIVWRNEYIGF